MQKPLHSVGDLVVFNETGEFGNKNDCLFHIHAMRRGKCTGIPKKQYWYAGFLLAIGKYESDGLPQVPIFLTTLTNASEDQLQSLEYLQVRFNPYQ